MSRGPTKQERFAELAQRLAVVYQQAYPTFNPVTCRIKNLTGRSPKFVIIGNEVVELASLTPLAANTIVANPAMLNISHPETVDEFRFVLWPHVKALLEKPEVYPWLDPRETHRLLTQARFFYRQLGLRHQEQPEPVETYIVTAGLLVSHQCTYRVTARSPEEAEFLVEHLDGKEGMGIEEVNRLVVGKVACVVTSVRRESEG